MLCKFFKCSPTDPKILNLTLAERNFLLLHIVDEINQENQKFVNLLMAIRPEAFVETPGQNIEETVLEEDAIIQELRELGKSEEEIKEILETMKEGGTFVEEVNKDGER